MDVSSMLSAGGSDAAAAPDSARQSHQYPTRHAGSAHHTPVGTPSYGHATQRQGRSQAGSAGGLTFTRGSPVKKDQKHIVFQLIDPEDPRIQARLPMRVMISPNDTTESIITTVKNFYGLYEYGVSCENAAGVGIIAAYDNFDNDMTVFVRTVAPSQGLGITGEEQQLDSVSPRKPTLAPPFEMRPPPVVGYGPSPSRSTARSAGVRSVSPASDSGRHGIAAVPGAKAWSHKHRSRENSAFGDVAADGYSSGDNGEGSVTSSRRSKTEQVNAEISVDNIVEGGRRKRAFESSELPLFVPPQVPMSTSISSISPQRRSAPGQIASPYAYNNQQTFSYQVPLPSPMSYGSGPYMQGGATGNGLTYQSHPRQPRGKLPGPQYRSSNGGILPTPDPTVGSVISDEDVALQLMRLGDASNFSHGRTSNSTADDALSGKADAASSEEEESDDDDEEEVGRLPAVPRFPKDDVGPARKKQRTMNDLPSDQTSGEEYEDYLDGTFKQDSDAPLADQGKISKSKSLKLGKPRAPSTTKPKTSKTHSHAKVPMSPSSMPAPSRKGSMASTINFQHQLADDEEDLSSKPRCQRCRKSKKGCDRQRPCGRCKDAGIGIEGCVSEDEGNGRKGRYGRHMGVPVKKSDDDLDGSPIEPAPMQSGAGLANGYFLAPALPDKNKKRKR